MLLTVVNAMLHRSLRSMNDDIYASQIVIVKYIMLKYVTERKELLFQNTHLIPTLCGDLFGHSPHVSRRWMEVVALKPLWLDSSVP